MLCVCKKVAEDMYKSAKSEKEKEFYQREINKINDKICVMVEYD